LILASPLLAFDSSSGAMELPISNLYPMASTVVALLSQLIEALPNVTDLLNNSLSTILVVFEHCD
jgi:hypothetical protein